MLQKERAPESLVTPLEPQELSVSLNPRLTTACAKNATRKHLQTLVAESIRCEFGNLEELRGCADRLNGCATWLKFREHYPSLKVHLSAGNFCDQHLLCTPCGHQRALELIRRYGMAVWHSHKRPVRHYMITLTWPSKKADLGSTRAGGSASSERKQGRNFGFAFGRLVGCQSPLGTS